MSIDEPIGLPPPPYELALKLLHDAHVELLMLRRDKTDLKRLLDDALRLAEVWVVNHGYADARGVTNAEAFIAHMRRRLAEIE